MEAIKGYENAKVIAAREQLPKGGYILKVLDVKEEKTDRAHYLKISFDINDGEYIDFYKRDYQNQQCEDKYWKGFINVFIPKEGDTYYENNLSRFKTIISDFEESNNNFHWDWDETKLKGKVIGGVFGVEIKAKEDGSTYSYTLCRYLTSVENIQQGKFKMPADKYKNGASPTSATKPEDNFTIDTDEDNLPF